MQEGRDKGIAGRCLPFLQSCSLHCNQRPRHENVPSRRAPPRRERKRRRHATRTASARLHRSCPDTRCRRAGHRRSQSQVRHHFWPDCIRRSSRPAKGVGAQRGLAPDRPDGQLHAHHELEREDDDRGVRSQAWRGSRRVEIRHRMGRRSAGSEPAPDLHVERRLRLAPGRTGYAAGGDSSRSGGHLSGRAVSEPARIPESGRSAGRQPQSDMALGAGRDGTRRSHGRSREGSGRLDQRREVSRSTRP